MHRKLFNLANDNRGKGAGLRAEANGNNCTDVYIYDVIDPWWGISAQAFAQQLAAITTPEVRLRINCPGGDVFDARAMMAAIAEHPATFTARIDGLCASAATALTLPCDTVEIVEGGFYMIHQAWTIAMGDAEDMRDSANMLDKVDAVLVAGYVAKCGKPEAEIQTLMEDETWFGAQEAVDAGFCDAVVAIPVGGSGKANARTFNLAVYERAPQALTTEPGDEGHGGLSEADEHQRLHLRARLNFYERTAG